MSLLPGLKYYDTHAASLASDYESLHTETVHPKLRELISSHPLAVLDVGAGSGRDAAWLASLGHEVTAIEPAGDLRAIGEKIHRASMIRWFDDLLPKLERTAKCGHSFDFILLSAVWMHIPPTEREEAFRALVSLLRPNGRIMFLLRYGPSSAEREMFPVSLEELKTLSDAHMTTAQNITSTEESDNLKRPEISWQSVLITVPGGYQRGLEILRREVLFTRRNSTYKLGFVRAILETIEKKPEELIELNDYQSAIPVRSVMTAWVELYRGLMAAGTKPKNQAFRAGLLDEKERLIGTSLKIVKQGPMAHMFEDRPGKIPLFGISESGAAGDALGSFVLSRRLAEAFLTHSALIRTGLLLEWKRFIENNARLV